MTLRDLFGIKNKDTEEPTTEAANTSELVEGKLIHVSKEGYGFITSASIPFERIFFHWTGLEGDTLKFPELKKGMKVQFKPLRMPDKGYRAIKITILNNGA